jgi:hypothetical protein
LTISFSIEDRDASGRKKSAFYSISSSRGTTEGQGWTSKEADVVRCVLSKHVVRATYIDAARRGILSNKVAAEEARAILATYNADIDKILGETDDTGTG